MIEKYFGNVDKEKIKEFVETTPEGNTIKGFICKARNKYLGSLLITEITLKDGKSFEVEQFVQAMPRIEYYSDSHPMFAGETGTTYPAYEKLDGTCLILYGLYIDDELIEIVPKTRGVPVADKRVIRLFNELDHAHIISFFEQDMASKMNPSLMFELYGTLNQHTIFYPEVRISIRLIGATVYSEFLNYFELGYLAAQYDFELPKVLFILIYEDNGKWRLNLKDGFLHYYLKDKIEFPVYDLSQKEAMDCMYEVMTIVNENYKKVNGDLLLEGCVVFCYNYSGENFKYIKVKPEGVTEQSKRAATQVPKSAIKKEVNKYFDEYGSKAKQLYIEDKTHYYDYVRAGLLEDFSEEMLDNKKTKNKIRIVFEDKLQEYSGGGKLREVCETIFKENPNLEVSDYMRIFSEYYPERKSRSAKAFNIFNEFMDNRNLYI